MSKAYKCDHCGELKEGTCYTVDGRLIANGGHAAEVCYNCWEKLEKLITPWWADNYKAKELRPHGGGSHKSISRHKAPRPHKGGLRGSARFG